MPLFYNRKRKRKREREGGGERERRCPRTKIRRHF